MCVCFLMVVDVIIVVSGSLVLSVFDSVRMLGVMLLCWYVNIVLVWLMFVCVLLRISSILCFLYLCLSVVI